MVEAKGACTAVHFGRSGSCWARLGHLEIAMLIKWVYGYPDVSRGSIVAMGTKEFCQSWHSRPIKNHPRVAMWTARKKNTCERSFFNVPYPWMMIWLSSVLNGVVLCKQWSKSDSCGCSQGPVCFRLDLWLVQIVQMVQFGSLMWFPVVYPGLCQATSMSRGLTLNLF